MKKIVNSPFIYMFIILVVSILSSCTEVTGNSKEYISNQESTLVRMIDGCSYLKIGGGIDYKYSHSYCCKNSKHARVLVNPVLSSDSQQ